jgi:hypothetical protein
MNLGEILPFRSLRLEYFVKHSKSTLDMPRLLFRTVTFGTISFDIPERGTVADAKRLAAREWKCSPADVLVLASGCNLADSVSLPISSTSDYVVIYKRPFATPVEPPKDPENFKEIVGDILSMGLGYDRNLIEQVLRETNYDQNEAVGRLMASPPAAVETAKDRIPDDIMARLMRAKRPHVSTETAIEVYRGMCEGNIELAEGVLSDMDQ